MPGGITSRLIPIRVKAEMLAEARAGAIHADGRALERLEQLAIIADESVGGPALPSEFLRCTKTLAGLGVAVNPAGRTRASPIADPSESTAIPGRILARSPTLFLFPAGQLLRRPVTTRQKSDHGRLLAVWNYANVASIGQYDLSKLVSGRSPRMRFTRRSGWTA